MPLGAVLKTLNSFFPQPITLNLTFNIVFIDCSVIEIVLGLLVLGVTFGFSEICPKVGCTKGIAK